MDNIHLLHYEIHINMNSFNIKSDDSATKHLVNQIIFVPCWAWQHFFFLLFF